MHSTTVKKIQKYTGIDINDEHPKKKCSTKAIYFKDY